MLKFLKSNNHCTSVATDLRRSNWFYGLPSPFLVLSTTKLTMTGIRQMGVMTRAKTTAGGGSLSSSDGQSWKYLECMSRKVCSTRGLGHGMRRQSDISSVQRLRLLYKPLTLPQTHQSLLWFIDVWKGFRQTCSRRT